MAAIYKSEKFKGVWILSVPTVYTLLYITYILYWPEYNDPDYKTAPPFSRCTFFFLSL